MTGDRLEAPPAEVTADELIRRIEADEEIHVLDVCETPLRLCRAYAERRGFGITQHVADALAFEPDRPFDTQQGKPERRFRRRV